MNNTQLYLTIGIPTITVILAWLSNKSDISPLRADNNALRAEMINLSKEIYEALIPLHERMTVIEVKQK
jgi:hypothetical protein